jgi:stage V sporulation protein SpoVS
MLLGAAGATLGLAGPVGATASSSKVTHHIGATTTAKKPKTPVSPTEAAVRSWLNAHEIVFADLQTDLAAVSAASNNGSVKAVASDCDQLAADVTTMMSVPPIPDPQIQGHWATALADFKAAADDCVQGLTQNDARASDQYKPRVHAGISGVDRVISELKKLQ